MPDVYDWPPVGILAHETTINRPGSSSRGLSGTPYYSQFQPTRTIYTATVSAMSCAGAAGGYVEALKILLDGKLPLIRVRPRPRAWQHATGAMGYLREPTYLTWTAGEDPTAWQNDGDPLLWITAGIVGTAGTSGGWAFLDCTGFPPNRLVAIPSETVTVGGGTATVLRPATSDASGAARLWINTALESGPVTLGETRRVFCAPDLPRTTQPDFGDYAYTFEMFEVFETEFTEAFTYLNPWGTDA